MTITDKKKYRVLIPTAGTGSRLNELTKYLNKSLVGIQNKPVLSRIIDMFPKNTEFVIALGYKGELVKQFIELAYPDRNFYFAQVDIYEGEGSGLGRSILACEKYLQQPFIFCSCDTIVLEKIPYPDKNMVGYSHRDNKNEYRTLKIQNDKVIKINEKGYSDEKSEPYIGLACISDWGIFWDEMRKGKEEAVKLGETYALLKFVQNGNLYAKKYTWFDTGNIEELKNTNEYFKEKDSPNILPKPDEAIWFIDDKVIKYSDNKSFIKDRVERIKYLKGFVPEILNSTENMYCYKKVDGMVLSKINDIKIFDKLLAFSQKFWQKKELSQDDKTKFREICRKFYYSKTKERIDLYYKTFGQKDTEYIINGKKYPVLEEILNKVDWENIYNGLAGKFHGDFHFENILYDEQADKFTFLDWRQNFGGIYEYGDIYYDLAKLNHGLIVCHELIAQNKFNIQIDGKKVEYYLERKSILEECEKYYYEWLRNNGYDVKKVKILTALIYLNIAALHHYPYCHLLYFLGKTMLYENII
jgi:choline kinase